MPKRKTKTATKAKKAKPKAPATQSSKATTTVPAPSVVPATAAPVGPTLKSAAKSDVPLGGRLIQLQTVGDLVAYVKTVRGLQRILNPGIPISELPRNHLADAIEKLPVYQSALSSPSIRRTNLRDEERDKLVAVLSGEAQVDVAEQLPAPVVVESSDVSAIIANQEAEEALQEANSDALVKIEDVVETLGEAEGRASAQWFDSVIADLYQDLVDIVSQHGEVANARTAMQIIADAGWDHDRESFTTAPPDLDDPVGSRLRAIYDALVEEFDLEYGE